MNVTPQSFAMMLLASQPVTALADDPSETAVPVVQVSGAQTDADARRQFVAGKIIIGRKRIEESGVRKVEDLLRREPAVTVGSDGRIGLLNMPGYTQVLLDGQAPVGRSPTEIDLVQVEKIEIVKSSMAEYGPFGIAGTINIISRKTARKIETEVVAGLESKGGESTATMDLSRNSAVEGSPFRYSFQLSAESGAQPEESVISESVAVPGQPGQLRWQGRSESKSRYKSLSGSFDLRWQRSNDETVVVSPSISTSRHSNTSREIRLDNGGAGYEDTSADSAPLDMLRVPLQWEFKPSKNSQVEISLMTALFRAKNESTRLDTVLGSQGTQRFDIGKQDGGRNSFEVLYRTRLSNGHNLKLGSTTQEMKRDFDHRYSFNGIRASAFDPLGSRSEWRNRSLRLFVQDEWELTDKVDVNAGLSGQATNVLVRENAYRAHNNSRLLSPSLHLSRKIGKDDANHVRLSIARSFKEVEEDDLSVHPEIHPRAPCVSASSCGSNSAETADSVGNGALRPEKSLGVNASYERSIGDGSHVNVEIFSRKIDDKMGTEIIPLSVPWSAEARYVKRPVNLGNARSSGISLEMELSLRDFSAAAPKLSIRGSAGLAKSRVTNVPGPENKLDRQTPWNAKLGSSYTMQALPITFDADASWAPSVWVRRNATQRIFNPRVFGFDAGAKWQLTPDRRVIVSWKSAFPRSSRTVNEFFSGEQRVSLFDEARTFSTVRVQFETSL